MDVQVTTFQGDAADEAIISGICKQAMQEEGRLDVFFANVCVVLWPCKVSVESDVMLEGWSCYHLPDARHNL